MNNFVVLMGTVQWFFDLGTVPVICACSLEKNELVFFVNWESVVGRRIFSNCVCDWTKIDTTFGPNKISSKQITSNQFFRRAGRTTYISTCCGMSRAETAMRRLELLFQPSQSHCTTSEYMDGDVSEAFRALRSNCTFCSFWPPLVEAWSTQFAPCAQWNNSSVLSDKVGGWKGLHPENCLLKQTLQLRRSG